MATIELHFKSSLHHHFILDLRLHFELKHTLSLKL
jgi:hypothetical protein